MSEWIEWKGGRCPLPAERMVEVECRNGKSYLHTVGHFEWGLGGHPEDIVAYRTVSPVGTTIAETDSTTAVLTERGTRYGPFVGHAEVTQTLKAVIEEALRSRKKRLEFDQQEALDMICHKIGRIVNGDSNYDDSWVDIAGYARLVADRLQGVTR